MVLYVNATSNGTLLVGIAVEFDTRHNFTKDGPNNYI